MLHGHYHADGFDSIFDQVAFILLAFFIKYGMSVRLFAFYVIFSLKLDLLKGLEGDVTVFRTLV